MTVIKIARTPRKAFNPKRPASKLLRAHIAHLEHASGVTPRKFKRLAEGDAAKYIAQLTARLLARDGVLPTPAAAPVQTSRPGSKKPAKRKRAAKSVKRKRARTTTRGRRKSR